jgi:hypothetical protein
MGKLNMDMLEGKLLLLQFLQANDDVILRGILPAALRYKCGANCGELLIVKDAFWRPLDVYDITRLDQLGSCGRSQSRPVLQRLGLAAKVENCRSHCVKIEGQEGFDDVSILQKRKESWMENSIGSSVWHGSGSLLLYNSVARSRRI